MALSACTDFFDPDKVTELISASLLADVHHMINAVRAGAVVAVNAALTLLYCRSAVMFGRMCGAESAPTIRNRLLRRLPMRRPPSMEVAGASSIASMRGCA
ncbi:TPA: hypothetical protein QDE50_36410 [Burkholderia cenocepacia]|nr:hypothetical protein [Burkholderia cenocepacia]HDR9889866.1 hypothetical protein [Burkholderia cenocepacia]